MWLTKKHKSWDSDFDLESLSDFPPKVRQTLASQDDYEGEYSSNKDSKTEPHKTRGERSREQLEIPSLSPLPSAPPLTIDLWLLGSNCLETGQDVQGHPRLLLGLVCGAVAVYLATLAGTGGRLERAAALLRTDAFTSSLHQPLFHVCGLG